jgi:hypothetical protein
MTRSTVRIEGTLSSSFENKTGLNKVTVTNIIQFSTTKLIQSIKMFPSGIKIDKEQLNMLAYADDIVLEKMK